MCRIKRHDAGQDLKLKRNPDLQLFCPLQQAVTRFQSYKALHRPSIKLVTGVCSGSTPNLNIFHLVISIRPTRRSQVLNADYLGQRRIHETEIYNCYSTITLG